jgi:hypothetical protein
MSAPAACQLADFRLRLDAFTRVEGLEDTNLSSAFAASVNALEAILAVACSRVSNSSIDNNTNSHTPSACLA